MATAPDPKRPALDATRTNRDYHTTGMKIR